MTFNPETDIAETRYDTATRVHTYVVIRDGRRWTVLIPDDEFARFGPVQGAQAAANKAGRRRYLATKIATALMGAPDE